MTALLQRMERPLRHLFRTTRPVLIATASSAGLMEAAVRSGVRERLLAVIGGPEGERFAEVAAACGKEVVRAVVPAGRTLEAAHLERFLDGPEVDAVSIVHSETATGALAPLEELARVVRAHSNVMLLVDASGSIGGQPVEFDLWQLDFVFTGGERVLALPPGLALAAASKRLMERARSLPERGWYFDLVRMDAAARALESSQMPAATQLHTLDVQLERIEAGGGLEARWQRHGEMRLKVEQWVDARPEWSLLAPAGRRSATVSALHVPAGVRASNIARQLAERGWQFVTGADTPADNLLTVSHTGDLTPDRLASVLAELSEIGTPV